MVVVPSVNELKQPQEDSAENRRARAGGCSQEVALFFLGSSFLFLHLEMKVGHSEDKMRPGLSL